MPRRSARLAAQAAAAAACPLLLLSDDVLEVVGHQISDALRPAVAGALAACNHNLWRVMRAPLAKLQPRHAAARALAAKVGSSCAELSGVAVLHLWGKAFDANDMATLAMLFSTGALAWVDVLDLAGMRALVTGGDLTEASDVLLEALAGEVRRPISPAFRLHLQHGSVTLVSCGPDGEDSGGGVDVDPCVRPPASVEETPSEYLSETIAMAA